jgi:hypothetical protein
MNIQEHLVVFDGWLTSRIKEAYASGKDLAFRDSVAEIQLGEISWEYSLLAPGQSAPHGDGWSVYRLQDMWPQFGDAAGPGGKRGLFALISKALFGSDKPR